MSSLIVVKQCGIDNYEWLQLSRQSADKTQEVAERFVGDGELLQQQSEQAAEVIMLADAQAVSLRQVSFDDHERKLLRQTIPYTLEDDCLDDVDKLQFAIGPVQGNSAAVAMIDRTELQRHINALEQQGVEVKQLVSELSFLPDTERGWTILISNDSWLVKTAAHQGFAVDSSAIGLALQLLLDESELPPEKITVYCATGDQKVLENCFPDLLKSTLEWQNSDYWQTIEAGLRENKRDLAAINLLQGEFARRLPWPRWWKMWRVVAGVLLTAIIVQLAVTYTRLNVLEAKNIELRAEIERTYRTAVPRGAVMDPERQLRRKVNALKGSGGDGFVALLDKVAPVITAVNGMSIQNLNYTEKQSEIRLTVLADGFDDVETARSQLEKRGLSAELTGSSADGNKTRARLKIRG